MIHLDSVDEIDSCVVGRQSFEKGGIGCSKIPVEKFTVGDLFRGLLIFPGCGIRYGYPDEHRQEATRSQNTE